VAELKFHLKKASSVCVQNMGEAGDLHFCFTFSQMARRLEMGFSAGKNGLDSTVE